MIKSYFTIAWRNLRRNKVISIVNIGGLMLGLTTGIIISLLLAYAFGFNKFHANYPSIHLLEMNQNFGGMLYTGNWTPAPLGPVLQKDLPALKDRVGRSFHFAVLKGRSNYLCRQLINIFGELLA